MIYFNFDFLKIVQLYEYLAIFYVNNNTSIKLVIFVYVYYNFNKTIGSFHFSKSNDVSSF